MKDKQKRTLTLLLDTRRRHWEQNPYVSLLAQGLTTDMSVYGFSWRRALFGRYDVVHVHWPEYLVHRKGRIASLAQKWLFGLWALRVRLFRIPVVKTMHNTNPHDSYGKLSKLLLSFFERSYKSRIWLNEHGEGVIHERSATDAVIPHGDYIPWLDALGIDDRRMHEAEVERRSTSTVRFLCFGIIKRYKSLDEPINAVSQSLNPDLRLVVAGSVSDNAYFTELMRLAGSDARISLLGKRLPDAELIDQILRSDFVVVPYRNLYNSGALLLALSLGRPVVVRRSRISESLLDEFGDKWIFLYDHYFSQEVIENLIQRQSDSSAVRKISPKRDWRLVSNDHLELYRRVVNN